MKRLKLIPDNSNGLVLKPKELLVTVAVVLVLTLLLPYSWQKIGGVEEIPRAFRLSEELRDDYYGYRLVARATYLKNKPVFIGDSVVWGKYVGNDHTLPELINRKLGKDEIVNLAVDGLHPVAMEKLLRDHGDSIRGNRVYLYWNPLWMNTPLYDLSGTEEFSINHPRLLPQFDPSYKSYRAKFGDRVSACLEQNVLFCAWLRHVRAAYCGNGDVKQVLAAGGWSRYDPAERRALADSTVTWEQNGIKKQDWPWVKIGDSRQYAAFRRVIAGLRRRANQVTVVLGTVNPHMQTPGSLERYRKLRAEVKADLEKKSGVTVIDLPELESGEYADASHPLAAGYEKLARYMIGQLTDKEK